MSVRDLPVFLDQRLTEDLIHVEMFGADLEDCQECAFGQQPDSPYSKARMLLDIAARREVLRHHQPTQAARHPGADCAWCGMVYPCFDVLSLAAPYAGRPDFNSWWRVS